jgi:hypothetical protein
MRRAAAVALFPLIFGLLFLAWALRVCHRYDLEYRMELANQGLFFDDEEVTLDSFYFVQQCSR